MCGIAGVLRCDERPVDRSVVQEMAARLQHRGPDHVGLHAEAGVGLTMARLAIIDLQQGQQPIYNEDESLVIVYNGELYNYKPLQSELRERGHRFKTNSDTEVILHAYEEYGADCLQHFDGMFAFAIYHRERRSLFLARDRLGIKPLYYTASSRTLAFASEATALLPGLQEVAPDWDAIWRYFSFGYITSPDAPFKDMRSLAPGQYAMWEDGVLSLCSYWTPTFEDHSALDFDGAVSALRTILDETVQRELVADVPVGVFLSGGLDSSAVAAYAKRHTSGDLHSFALRFDEATHDESTDARTVASHLGTIHHEVAFDSTRRDEAICHYAATLDAPFADATVLPLYTLSAYARTQVKVVLTGWGGDELFAGYPTYRAHCLARWLRRGPLRHGVGLLRRLVHGLPVSDRYMSFEFKAKRFLNGMDESPELQHMIWMGYFNDQEKAGLFSPEVKGAVHEETYAPVFACLRESTAPDLLQRIQHLDTRFFLEGNGLFQADRYTMARGLEARVPLINNRLFDFVSSLPMRIKMHRGRTKELLRAAMIDELPAAILTKPKKGFGPPVSSWVRGPLRPVMERVLDAARIAEQGVIQPVALARLMEEHRTRTADHGRKLWALASFQIWYEQHILRSQPEEWILS